MNTDKRRKMKNNEWIETNPRVLLLSLPGFMFFLIRVYLCASVVSNSVPLN